MVVGLEKPISSRALSRGEERFKSLKVTLIGLLGAKVGKIIGLLAINYWLLE